MPSGSQYISPTPSGRLLTRRASPPARLSTQICEPFWRLERNASVWPSGDQRGERSEAGPWVTWRLCPVATSASQTRPTPRLSWSELVVRVYATHLPSGESWGSLTVLSAMKSSKVMARF